MIFKIIKNFLGIVMMLFIVSFTIFSYNKYKYNEKIDINDYYYDVNEIERNSLGIFSASDLNYIENASNEYYKSKIIELIKDYNNGSYKEFDGEYRNEIEKLLADTETIFIGDSNVKHFLYYDILDSSHYIEFEGKNILEQSKLVKDKLDESVKNVILFNGYNLEVFNDSEEYISAYIELISSIKSISPSAKIYITSLLPATKEVIYDDLESAFPKKIYNGKEFDKAIENYQFDNASYVDTKWMVRDDLHKVDGVHMVKEYYSAYIPYMAYYTLLYNNEFNNIDENEVSDESLEKIDTIEEDILIFDIYEQWDLLKEKYGEEALKVLDDTVFVGDSNQDRLTRPIQGKLTVIAKPGRTLRQFEREMNQVAIMGKKYIVIDGSINDYNKYTDLIEYEYEYRYLHDLYSNSDVSDVFVCSYYIDNGFTQYTFNNSYDKVIRKVCDEFENFHYVDFKPLWKKEYISDDGHWNYKFNLQAFEILLKELNRVGGKEIEVLNDIDRVAYNENKLKDSKEILEMLKDADAETSFEQIDEIEYNSKNEVIKLGKLNNDDIEWIVINEDEEEKTLLSKYIYLNLPYNNEQESITWETSTLRKYLNEVFYENSFNDGEKNIIIKSKVLNLDNEVSEQKAGNDTYDYVYIPSIYELNIYTKNDDEENKMKKLATKCIDLKSKPKLFVNTTKGKWYEGNSPYWLRTPGLYDDDAAYVNYNGEISYNGVKVSIDMQGVRLMIKVRNE